METPSEAPKTPAAPSARPSARPTLRLGSDTAPPRYGYFLDGWREMSRSAPEEFTLA